MTSIKKILPSIRPYRGQMILVLVLGAIMSLCQGVVAPLAAVLFDYVFSNSKPPDHSQISKISAFIFSLLGSEKTKLVVSIPLTFVVLYFINGIVRYFHFFLVRYVGEKMGVDIRKKLQQKYLDLSIGFHSDTRGGEMINKTLNDVLILQQGLYLFVDFVREPFLATLLLGNLLLLDWKLTLYTLISAPVFALVIRKTGRSLKKYGYRSQESLDTLTSTLKETFDGVKIIQSFGLEGRMRERFAKDAQMYLDSRRKIVSHEELVGPITEFLGVLIFASLCLYVGRGALEGTSSAGVFVGFLIALGLMQNPLKKLQDAYSRIQQVLVVIDRVFEVLDNERKVKEIANPKPYPQNWRNLIFKNVSFSFGREKVLKDVNLTVKRGEVVAIVGESGSGKSTLMNLLERFFDPQQGEILLDETRISDLRVADLRKQIALVTQDVFLFDDTVAFNIHSGDFSKSSDGVVSAAKMANAHTFIESLHGGYQYKVGERGQKLSGGEKQRVSIARALFRDAPILILDEATSALDSISEIEVQKGLEQLMKGRTCFVIAHRLSTVRSADRILVFQKGSIVESGSHEELLTRRGEYYKFYQIQTEGQAN